MVNWKDRIDFEGVEKGDFSAFVKLMHELRGADGCPWDREQTMDSLKSCMLDEQLEVLAGIDICERDGDGDNLCEELGDLLMHVVMLADLGAEKGLFSMEDVIRGIGQKMLRRHPHVFGEESRRGWDQKTAGELKEIPADWKSIKALEKEKTSEAEKERQKKALKEAIGWAKDFMN